jgi:hypothetical protein
MTALWFDPTDDRDEAIRAAALEKRAPLALPPLCQFAVGDRVALWRGAINGAPVWQAGVVTRVEPVALDNHLHVEPYHRLTVDCGGGRVYAHVWPGSVRKA